MPPTKDKPETTQAAPLPERSVAPSPARPDPAVERSDEAPERAPRPRGYDDTGIRHPAVEAVALPESSSPARRDAGGPVPTIVHSATPNLAKAQANLEADYEAGASTPAEVNVRARAAAGHRTADTVDLPEARIRAEDNAAALDGGR